MKRQEVKKEIVQLKSGLPICHANAAGIDIGDTLQCVAISNGAGGYEVKTTTGFTCDLEEIVEYLVEKNITTVAMESTGIYWLTLYTMLEEAGIEVYLVNAKHVKNVTGRKKDDTDAIWLQKLHSCGLLQKSFQPDNEIRILRNYTRQRKNINDLKADVIRRMQKALELMNIKLHTVISDIVGKSGLQIVKAIVEGERDAEKLVDLCDGRVKAKREVLIKSLQGRWSEDYIFILEQALEQYIFLTKQMLECDKKLEGQLKKQVAIVKQEDHLQHILPQKKGKKQIKNEVSFDLNQYLISLTGVDISKVQGIVAASVLELISEIGIDMTKWNGQKQFAAWLNLTPNTKISGGKVLSSKKMKKKNRAGQILKQAASTLSHSKSPLGDYYRKMRAKLGGKGAVVSVAHKLARIIYTMLLTKSEFRPELIELNDQKAKEKK